MVTRAMQDLQYANIKTFVVKAASAATKGKRVKLDSAGTVLDATTNDRTIGTFYESAVAGARVQVILDGQAHEVLVGTGGATCGAYATCVSDGLTDITPGGGTTLKNVCGIFLETGVAADYVGMMQCPHATVSS